MNVTFPDTAFALVVITSPEDFAGEHDLIEALLEGGLHRLHLRKPNASPDKLERWLMAIDAKWRSQIVIHGHPAVAISLGLAGWHCREQDTSNSCEIKPVSQAVHSWDALYQCEQRQYVLLSPLFDSISKPGLKGSLEGAVPPDVAIPVIALGGVEPSHFAILRQRGFAGAALLGAIWNAPDPLRAWVEAKSSQDLADAQ